MGGLAADDSVVGLGHRIQAEAVRGRAIEYEEDLNIFAKVTLELPDGGLGVSIIAITDNMPLIHGGDRFHNFGMDPSIIVAGETADGFHVGTI